MFLVVLRIRISKDLKESAGSGSELITRIFFLSFTGVVTMLKVVLPVAEVAVPQTVVEDVAGSIGRPVLPPCRIICLVAIFKFYL